jgi:hypothetical protein
MKRTLTTRLALSRRQLMHTLGASGAATFLPWLRPRNAAAAGPPTRLLVFWSGSGVPRQTYSFKAAGGGAPTETDFVFPDVRGALNPIKKDLIAFENLDMVSATVDPLTAANAHYAGETHSLSAVSRANRDTAGGPSIDQFVAKSINSPSPVTRLPSLSLTAQVDGNVAATKVCTAGPGQVIALDPSPSNTYKRLFSGVTLPTAMKPAMPAGPTDAQLQNKSVLDLVLADFDAVRTKLGKSEVTKLDAHADAVRDLEKRLGLIAGQSVGSPTAGCADPTMSVLAGTGNRYPATSDLYKANFTAMSKLVQAAFACDLTRVVLLAVSEPIGADWGYTSGNWGTTDAHDLIHKTSYNQGGTLKANADAMKAISNLHDIEARQFAAMLDLLRAVPEADGKTLLDHTIVLWCSQIGEHGHALDYLPWIMAGGSTVGFKPGRYLQYARGADGKGASHSNLFVSIAQAMGVQATTFGNPKTCTGPLDRLRV